MKYLKLENLKTTQGTDYQIVTLNRPEIKNAFNPEMISEITDYFQNVSLDSKIQLIILRGEGTVFCAGADLNWMQGMVQFSYEENIADSNKLFAMFESVYSCAVPVIAVAQGAVFGGGLGILAAADYVISERNTQFCFSEVKLGLAPAVITHFVSRKISDGFLRPLMLSAELFSTENAVRIGLVQQVFEGAISNDAIAAKFEKNGLVAMRETKKLLNYFFVEPDRENRKSQCVKVISERRMSDEGQLRLKNFIKK